MHLQKAFEDEIDSLLDQGIIELSDSPHCSPRLMVKKGGSRAPPPPSHSPQDPQLCPQTPPQHHPSSTVLPQPDPPKYRLACDYRTLNSITRTQAEPPCFIDEELHKFSGAKYFAEIDLAQA